jgi:ADP-heptose:LPS heptosyltransferase
MPHITWMVERRDREAIDANPYVDESCSLDSKYWKRLTRSGLYPIWAVLALRLRHMILQRQFDTLISFQPEDWPTLTRILGNAVRIGIFDTFREYHGQTRTSRRARLFSRPFVYEEHPPHRVDQYLLPLKALDLPEPTPEQKRLVMGFTETDLRLALEYIDRELKGQPFVVVAPLTGWPSRVWPAERFAAVSDLLQERTGHKVVLVSGGGEKDRAVIEEITGRMRHPPSRAVGTFGFRALSALISKAALVLSGDTGPMHIASAFDTPYVALFGPSPIERFAPIVGKGLPMARSVPCGPCHQLECPNQGDDHQLCLKLLTVDDVFAAATSFLNSQESPVHSLENMPFSRQSSPV